MRRPIVVSLVLALTTVGVLVSPAAAQSAPHCAPGTAPEFDSGFAWLERLLGPAMGEPTTCPYVNSANGDVLQETSTGLAFWRKSTNTPTFTDGWDHWAWTPQGLVHWTGTSIDPTAGAEVVPPPAAEPPQVSRVQIPLIALGQGELGCNDAVVFVERTVSPTAAPLAAALEELLALDERLVGTDELYNALYQADLRVDSVVIQDSTAIIHLTGQLRLGGVCDNPRVEAQLRQVALQFETVDSVQVFIDGQSLEEVLSLR